MIRKILFWTHLTSGVIAGLVIFMMSATGVILMYERQILNWAEQKTYLPPAQHSTSSMPLSEFLEITNADYPGFTPTSITITNHPGAPVTLSAGRGGGSITFNPYTGTEMLLGSVALENFFRTITGWHRWFNAGSDNRATARAITGASNLLFLFLIVSGIYLWLPKIWVWSKFKIRLLLLKKPPNSQARDFNWHHVFGIWCAIPLLIIVATATVFNYSWANNLVYQVYGEEPPQRSSAPSSFLEESTPALNPNYLTFDQLMDSARSSAEQALGNWHTITLNLPALTADSVDFSINQSIGGQPQKQFTLQLDRRTGEPISIAGLSDRSPGRQTRSIIRFLHTGEVLGFWGQTIAGIVSLATLFMVWSGFALAYRRLIQPLFRKT